jgi:hypothetical protein
MEINQILEQLKLINNKWHKEKVNYFKGEPLYIPEKEYIEFPDDPNLIEWLEPSKKENAQNPESINGYAKLPFVLVDYTDEYGNFIEQDDAYRESKRTIRFKDYCFNSSFIGSIRDSNENIFDNNFSLPIDLNYIIQDIKSHVNSEFPDSLPPIILIPELNDILQNIHSILFENSNAGRFLEALKKDIYRRIERWISKKYKYHYKAYNKHYVNKEPILTLDKCQRICELKLVPGSLRDFFITKNPELTAHKFLFDTLSINPIRHSKTYFNLECEPSKFYNFILNILNFHVLNIKNLEESNAFEIREKPFNAGNFKTFKSRNPMYPLPGISEILSS